MPPALRHPILPWGLAVLSAVLLAACFAPWNQVWLCWFALMPLTAAVWFAPPWRRLPRWAQGFGYGYAMGLVFFWAVFYWLIEVTGLGWFILAFYLALYGAVWGAFLGSTANPMPPERYLRSRWNLWYAFLGAAAWTALEWVRGWMFSGFGWNALGVSFHANLPFIQIAAWTGVGGLTFLAAFANLIGISTVYRFMLEVRAHRIRPHFDFTLTISAVLAVFAFGVHKLQTPPAPGIPLRVAAVQPNVPQPLKFDPAYETRILEAYRRLSDAAIATRPQLLLWPEAATPRGVFADKANFEFVRDIAQRANCNLLFGTLDYDYNGEGQAYRSYNAAVLAPPGESDWQTYRKIHLVPFGEYVPFRHSFPLFAWIVGDEVPEDFDAGAEPVVFELQNPTVLAAPLICFEDTLGRFARKPVLLGAQILVNLTNDGWFGHSAANEQQLDESIFRTVENNRPLLRCANTGVTAFIDSQGRPTRVLRGDKGTPFVAGIMAGEITAPVSPALTFYTVHGEVFSVACAAAAVVAAMLFSARRLVSKL